MMMSNFNLKMLQNYAEHASRNVKNETEGLVTKATQEISNKGLELKHGRLKADEFLNIKSDKLTEKYLEKFEGVPGLDLSGQTITGEDIPKGYVFHEPIVDGTVFDGDWRDMTDSFELHNPIHEKHDGTLTFKKWGKSPTGLWDGEKTTITINNGNLNKLNMSDLQGGVDVHNLNAQEVNVKDTQGLNVTKDYSTPQNGQSPIIQEMNLENSTLNVQGADEWRTPPIKEVNIAGSGNKSTIHASEGHAIKDLYIKDGADGTLHATGKTVTNWQGNDKLIPPVGTVNLRDKGSIGTLNDDLGVVNAYQAGELRVNPKTLSRLSSTETPTSLHGYSGTKLGNVTIEDSPNAHVYLSANAQNPVKADSIHINGGQTSDINIDGVNASGNIHVNNLSLPERAKVKISNSKASSISADLIGSSTAQKASVKLHNNTTKHLTLGGENLSPSIIGTKSPTWDNPQIDIKGLSDSDLLVHGLDDQFPHLNIAGVQDSTIDLGVGKFPETNVENSANLNLRTGDRTQAGDLNLKNSSAKVDGGFYTVNAASTELLPGTQITTRGEDSGVNLDNLKSSKGLRIADPKTGFVKTPSGNVDRDFTTPQIVSEKKVVISRTDGLQGLEIAGRKHNVTIRSYSDISGAKLTGGAGENVKIGNNSKFKDARIVREKGVPVSYPHLEDLDSSIKGLREEGGLGSKFRNIGYRIQDFFGMGGRR